MRIEWALAALMASCAYGQPSLHLLMDFERAVAPATLTEIERETASLLADTGVPVAWHTAAGVNYLGVSAGALTVHFTGACELSALPSKSRVTGGLARVNLVDLKMLPEVWVNCDAVAAYLRPAMDGTQLRSANVYLGRALARVLAHEMYHALTGSAAHTRSALFRSSFSASALLAERLQFEPGELARLRTVLGGQRTSPRANVI